MRLIGGAGGWVGRQGAKVVEGEIGNEDEWGERERERGVGRKDIIERKERDAGMVRIK